MKFVIWTSLPKFVCVFCTFCPIICLSPYGLIHGFLKLYGAGVCHGKGGMGRICETLVTIFTIEGVQCPHSFVRILFFFGDSLEATLIKTVP